MFSKHFGTSWAEKPDISGVGRDLFNFMVIIKGGVASFTKGGVGVAMDFDDLF